MSSAHVAATPGSSRRRSAVSRLKKELTSIMSEDAAHRERGASLTPLGDRSNNNDLLPPSPLLTPPVCNPPNCVEAPDLWTGELKLVANGRISTLVTPGLKTGEMNLVSSNANIKGLSPATPGLPTGEVNLFKEARPTSSPSPVHLVAPSPAGECKLIMSKAAPPPPTPGELRLIGPLSPGAPVEPHNAFVFRLPEVDDYVAEVAAPALPDVTVEPDASLARPPSLGESAALLARVASELAVCVDELASSAGCEAMRERLIWMQAEVAQHGARCRAAAGILMPPQTPKPNSSAVDASLVVDAADDAAPSKAAPAATPPPRAVRQDSESTEGKLTPSYGDTTRAVSKLIARWRGREVRVSATGTCVASLRLRGRAAHDLLRSEIAYADQLRELLTKFFAPLLTKSGTSGGHLAGPLKSLAAFFGTLQVLLNLSGMMVAQINAASETPCAPSAAAASTLLALLPSYKCYTLYVSALTASQQTLASMREADASVDELLAGAEVQAGDSLANLLVAPARRLPNYGLYVEQMLKLTPLEAQERTAFCRALSAVNELCAVVETSLADHESRAKVVEMASSLKPALKGHPQLADGLAVPHRRFLWEGALTELELDDHRGTRGTARHAVLFNDLLLVLSEKRPGKTQTISSALQGAPSSPPSIQVVDCISLAKVQVKNLPQSDGQGASGGVAGAAGRCSFELWSMARIWRYAAPSETARDQWVDKLQSQVRSLLASFKQRGRSLAFLPQNVQALRARLQALHQEKQLVEQQVLEYTAQMCALDERSQKDKAAMARLQRAARRSMGGGQELAQARNELAQLRLAANEAADKYAQMQATTDACVEKLYELNNALEATDEQHNDDSLLQFMLFSTA